MYEIDVSDAHIENLDQTFSKRNKFCKAQFFPLFLFFLQI